jgi:hypothetical protein
MYGEAVSSPLLRYSRIGFPKGLINEAHGELTASPLIPIKEADCRDACPDNSC